MAKKKGGGPPPVPHKAATGGGAAPLKGGTKKAGPPPSHAPAGSPPASQKPAKTAGGPPPVPKKASPPKPSQGSKDEPRGQAGAQKPPKVDLPSGWEQLEGAAFEDLLGVHKATYGALPPFRQARARENARKKLAQAEQKRLDDEAKQADAERAKLAEEEKLEQAKAQEQMQAIANKVASSGPNALKSMAASALLPSAAVHGSVKELKGFGSEYKPCYYVLWPEAAVDGIPKGESYLLKYESDRSAKALKVTPVPQGSATAAARKTSTTGEPNSFRVVIKDRSRAGGKVTTTTLDLAAPSGRKRWIAALEQGAAPAEEVEEEDEDETVQAEVVEEDVSVATLESLEGAAFEELFGLSKEKYEDLPPFRRNQKKAAAQAKYKAQAQEKNASAQAAAASKQAELDAKAAAEAEKRTKVGDYIAQKGTAALLGASPLFLKDYAVHSGSMRWETPTGFNAKHCVVFPNVVFPSIPPAERFFFIFANDSAKRPEAVAHLVPEVFSVAKPKSSRAGQKFCIRLDAPVLTKESAEPDLASSFGDLLGRTKRTKFIMAAPTFEQQSVWMDALQSGGSGGTVKGEKSTTSLLSLSAEDFYVKIGKKKARLSVGKASVQLFVDGKKTEDRPFETIKRMEVGEEKGFLSSDKTLTLTLTSKKTFVIYTDEGQKIMQTIEAQAEAHREEQAEEARQQQAAREKEEAAAAAVAAEKARWLTIEQLRSGDYKGCTRLPVDEKNKEHWLTDADFQQVFGKSKAEWAKVPPFKRPMIKKKLGLQAIG